MRSWILSISILLTLGVTLSSQREPARIVDLGHPIQQGDPSWDGKVVYQRTVVATMEKDGYAAGKISIEEHFGTHLDAPVHFAAAGWSVDRIPVDRLYRPGVRLDVSKQVAANPDYQVTREDVTTFERQSGQIPRGAVILIATGWDRFWPDRAKYMNEKNGVKHFPGLTAEAVTLLARDREVAGIGIDTPSIDYGPSTTFDAHRVSMPLNVYHVENAAHLTTLPASGFRVMVAPLNIGGGSGAPTRIFAVLN